MYPQLFTLILFGLVTAFTPGPNNISAAYSGFNSWQEHAETTRYLNSSFLYQDLPDINLIVSFGGIQDFWNFLRLLVNEDIKTTDNYKIAKIRFQHI